MWICQVKVLKSMRKLVLVISALFAAACSGAIDLAGSWEFRFEEGKTLETCGGPDFAATDRMRRGFRLCEHSLPTRQIRTDGNPGNR